MATTTHGIEILIKDRVSPSLIKKLESLAQKSEQGHREVSKLKQALDLLTGVNLSGFVSKIEQASSAFSELNSQQEKLNREAKLYKSSLSGLASQQSKNQQSTVKNKLALDKLEASQLKVQQGRERLRLATIRANQGEVKLAADMQKTATLSAKLNIEQSKLSLSRQKVLTENNRTAASYANLVSATNRAVASQARLEKAQERGVRSTRNLRLELSSLTRVMGTTLAPTIGTAGLLNLADQFTLVQNKMRVFTEEEEEVNALTRELFDLAQRNRIAIDGVSKAFLKFHLTLRGMNKDFSDTLSLVDTISKVLILSGSATSEQVSSLLQLSQAFSKTKLDGDEFRSISENMSMALDILIKHLQVGRGELFHLSRQGKITAEVLFDAFRGAKIETAEQFARTIPTVAQAFVNLRTALILHIGEMDKSWGMAESFARAIIALSKNLKFLESVLVHVGVSLLVAFSPAVVRGIRAVTLAIFGFNGVLRTNPIGAVAFAIANLITYMYLYKDSLGLTKEEIESFGQVSARVFSGLANMAKRLIQLTRQVGEIFVASIKLIGDGTTKAINTLLGSLNVMTAGINSLLEFVGLEKILNENMQAVDIYKEMGKELAKLGEAYEKTAGVMNRTPLTSEPALKVPGGDILKGAGKKPSPKGDLTKITGLQKIKRGIEQEISLTQLLTAERRIESQLLQYKRDLQKDGITLSKQELGRLREKLSLLDREQQISREVDLIYSETLGKFDQLEISVEAVNRAYERGYLSADQYREKLAQIEKEAKNLVHTLGGAEGTGIFENFGDRLGNSLSGVITQTRDLQSALLGLSNTILNEVTRSIVNSGTQWLIVETKKQFALTSTTAAVQAQSGAVLAATGAALAAQTANAAAATTTSTVAAKATEAAWTPAALVASVGSFGAAAVTGLASLVAAMSSVMTGFSEGGYTGNTPRDKVAGVVHGQEYVFDARSTARIGVDNLQRLQQSSKATPSEPPATSQESRPVQVVNVVDQELLRDFLISEEGEDVFVNMIRRNSSLIREVL